MTSHAGTRIEIEHDGATVALGGPVVTVGRSKDATLRVIHPLVSRLHCRIEITDEGVFVSDLQSVNGTHVNEVAVKAPVRLVRGDAITLGKEGALLHVVRAEFDGRDLLDPDAGDQATMLVGDPRARDIAARLELGAGAAEQNTAAVPPPPPPNPSPTPPRPAPPSPAKPPGPPPRPRDVAPAAPAPAAPPKPPGPPPRPRDVAPAAPTRSATPPKPPLAKPAPAPSPAAKPVSRAPSVPSVPSVPPPPTPPAPVASNDTISLVPLPDLTEETPLADDDVPELPDHTIPVDGPNTMPYAGSAPLDRTVPAHGATQGPADRTVAAHPGIDRTMPAGAAPPVDRTIEADPSPPKDIYTVMPLASAVLGSADTSPIPAATLRRVRELAAEREAAALAEQAGHAPAAAAHAAGASTPAASKPGGLVAGLLVGLATGVALAYGVSLLLARSGS